MNIQSPGELYRQLSFISYYFHWDLPTVLELPHLERQKFCREINRINREISTPDKNLFEV